MPDETRAAAHPAVGPLPDDRAQTGPARAARSGPAVAVPGRMPVSAATDRATNDPAPSAEQAGRDKLALPPMALSVVLEARRVGAHGRAVRAWDRRASARMARSVVPEEPGNGRRREASARMAQSVVPAGRGRDRKASARRALSAVPAVLVEQANGPDRGASARRARSVVPPVDRVEAHGRAAGGRDDLTSVVAIGRRAVGAEGRGSADIATGGASRSVVPATGDAPGAMTRALPGRATSDADGVTRRPRSDTTIRRSRRASPVPSSTVR